MSVAASRFKEERRVERGIADFIPYRGHVSPTAVVTSEGDLIRIWKLDGISFVTEEDDIIERRKDEMNMLLRSMATVNTAIWTHQVRRRVSDRLHGEFKSEFAERVDRLYYEGLSEADAEGVGQVAMMANELYVTLVYRPAPLRVDRINRKAAKRNLKEILEDQQAAIEKMDELAGEFESGLRRYGPQPLAIYEDQKGTQYSEVLEFLNYLITGERQKVRVPRGPLNEYLGNAYLFVGTETVVIRSGNKDRFAQLIDMKDYPEVTEAGILNKVMLLDVEYIMTQSFSFLDKRAALKFLERTETLLMSTEDGSATQLGELAIAKDSLIQGRFVMGEYHFTIMVYGDTRALVDKAASDVLTSFKEDGFLPVKVATATDAAFYAQMPCNWDERPRVATITSMNFAGLSPFHNFHQGKRDGNPWGQAVTLLRTPSIQPLYFNFHVSRDDEDAYDRKTLGNTRIIGASGTGKTVTMNFLLSQLTKFESKSPTGFGAVFLDKDRGAELAVRSMGGKYNALRSGQPTGFNPFQIEPTEANLLFLARWTASLVVDEGGRLSAADEQRISGAVRAVMKMPKSMRRLSIVHQNIPEGTTTAERENSVSRRLERWIGDGPLAWVADNSTDSLDLTTHSLYGFDGTAFLDDKLVCPIISSYLLHRMEEMIDGRRFSYWMDEAWKWVDSPAFAEFAGNKQLTIRKQNGFGVFATQMPSSLLSSPIGASLVQQCATEIYLPNPKADRDEYVKGFKLTETEFELIAEMPEACRMFMVKQGHRSSLAKLDLGHLGADLPILSGSTDDVEIFDEIAEEHGHDVEPAVWRPLFDRLRRERRGRKSVVFTP